MRIKDLFSTMYKLPRSGIYGLVNHKSRMVYISYSKDICTSISRLLRDIHSKNCIYKHMIKDASKLQFVKLEDINNYETITDIRIKIDYFTEKYKQEGYSLYNKLKPQKLKVRLDVVEDRVHVKLVSAYGFKMVVGVFEKMYEAEEFATVFDGMDIVKPVYAINELTKNYIKNNFKTSNNI